MADDSADKAAEFTGSPTAVQMLTAYAAGVFPMAQSRTSTHLVWVDPVWRGVFPLDGGFHVSRSLQRRIRRGGYRAVLNGDFAGTVDACADRPETWINPALRRVYLALHAQGTAHSWEIRGPDGALWGGVFGLTMGKAFFGESMVSRVTDGSKLALAHLVDHLRRCGYTLFDTQFLTPHLESLGAIEIPRARYRVELALALDGMTRIDALPPETDHAQVLQRMTHTS